MRFSLNFFILALIVYLVRSRKVSFDVLFNASFFFLLLFDFLVLIFISLRISFLAAILGCKIKLKDIYLISISIKFYQIFLPSVLSEGIRGTKYFLSGIKNRYDIIFLVIFDRIIGFMSFFFLFILSFFFLRPNFDKAVIILLISIFIVFAAGFINIGKIRKLFQNTIGQRTSIKSMIAPLVFSLFAQIIIVTKYFYLFNHCIVGFHKDFLQTLYISSAAHLSQIVPLTTGIFSIKDGFLFLLLKEGSGNIEKAFSVLLLLGSLEFFMGIVGGIVEFVYIIKKSIRLRGL
jgi:hypothetical protein